MKKLFYKVFLLCFSICLLAGCRQEVKQEKQESLVVCSSMGRKMSKLLVKKFSEQTGLPVQLEFLPAGTQKERFEFLKNRQYDIWLGGSVEEYYLANEQGMLEPYLAKDSYMVPAQLRSRSGQWTTLYLSYIGLLSNRAKLSQKGLYAPNTWDELLTPELKDEITMVDFIYGGASYGMLTSLWQLRGAKDALQFASSLNLQNVEYAPNVSAAVNKVYHGEKTVAVVPLDYALLMESQNKHLFATVVQDANRNILTGAAIMKTRKHVAQAQAFLDYLMSDAGEKALVDSEFKHIWHVKHYPYNDGRRELIGNVQVPVDDLGWTSMYKSETIREWLQAGVKSP